MDILKSLFFLSLISFSFGEIIRIPIFSIEIKLLDITVAILFLVWILVSVIKKRVSKIVYLPFMTFSFVGGVSLLFNLRFLNLSEFLISFSYLARWIAYASIFSIVNSFEKKFKSRMENFVFFLGSIVVVLGYIQYIFYNNLRNLYYLGWDEHLYRMFSVFLDPNLAGAFFVLYFLFLLSVLFKNFKNRAKLIFISIISLLTLLAVLLTYSRSAFFMLIVGVCIFLIMKKKAIFIGVLIIAFVLLTFLLPKAYKTEGTNFFRTASSEARLDSAYNAISVFERSPIFGVGFNAYRYAKMGYGNTVSGWEKSHADASTDNSFLFVLATTGVIGFAAFVFLWYKIIKLNKESALIVSSIIALFVDSLFINSLFYVFFLFWIWVIMGVRENN